LVRVNFGLRGGESVFAGGIFFGHAVIFFIS